MTHPANPAELRTPPTANPCPPWCELGSSTTRDRERLIRYHAGHEMRLPLSAGGSAGVEITCEESADPIAWLAALPSLHGLVWVAACVAALLWVGGPDDA